MDPDVRKPDIHRKQNAGPVPKPRDNTVDGIIDRYQPEATRPADRHNLAILSSLRRIARAIDIHSRQLSVQHGVTTPQLICLLTLAEDGPMTGTLLAQRLYMSPSTVNGVINRLEDKKLVQRTRETTDRRVVRITLTPRGHRLLVRAPSPLQQHLVDALAALPEKELADIEDSLNRVVTLMEARDIDAAPVLYSGNLAR
jgi:DNA-binding MarR family transcriptional regulator